MKLLTRKEFREQVLDRDEHKCVCCGSTKHLSAHHIIERKLWSDGGYYVDNGASLCTGCHKEAEMTVLTCDGIRKKAGIKNVLLPEGWDESLRYDKWGNIRLVTGDYFEGPIAIREDTFEKFKKAITYSSSIFMYPITRDEVNKRFEEFGIKIEEDYDLIMNIYVGY